MRNKEIRKKVETNLANIFTNGNPVYFSAVKSTDNDKDELTYTWYIDREEIPGEKNSKNIN